MRRKFKYVDYDGTTYRDQPKVGYFDWDQKNIFNFKADNNWLTFIRFGMSIENRTDRIYIKGADGRDYVLGVNPDNWQEFEWFLDGIAANRRTGRSFDYLNPTDHTTRRVMSFDDTVMGSGKVDFGRHIQWKFKDRLVDKLRFNGNLPDYLYLVMRRSNGFHRIRHGQDVWQCLTYLPAPTKLSSGLSLRNYIRVEDGRWVVYKDYIRDQKYYPDPLILVDVSEALGDSTAIIDDEAPLPVAAASSDKTLDENISECDSTNVAKSRNQAIDSF